MMCYIQFYEVKYIAALLGYCVLIAQYTTWERCFIPTLLQFAILSVLTEPAMKAHSHAPVMRSLKEMTAIHQVCRIQTYTLYSIFTCTVHSTHKHVLLDVVYSEKRLFNCSILQFVILSALTEPVIPAHLHAPVMRGLKETIAVHQVCSL